MNSHYKYQTVMKLSYIYNQNLYIAKTSLYWVGPQPSRPGLKVFTVLLWYINTIGCDSRQRHCRRDDIAAWRPNKIMLLSLLPLDLTMYHCFISFFRAVQSREGRQFNPRYCLWVTMVSTDPLSLARCLEREPHQTMGITWCAHPVSGKHFL